jgi:hypothetical protein
LLLFIFAADVNKQENAPKVAIFVVGSSVPPVSGVSCCLVLEHVVACGLGKCGYGSASKIALVVLKSSFRLSLVTTTADP